MSEMPTPQQNHLLAALSAEVQNRLAPHLELVPMPLGKVLYESGDALHHAYFPTDSIVSLLYVMENGASAEISVVGNEGLIGIAVFMLPFHDRLPDADKRPFVPCVRQISTQSLPGLPDRPERHQRRGPVRRSLRLPLRYRVESAEASSPDQLGSGLSVIVARMLYTPLGSLDRIASRLSIL